MILGLFFTQTLNYNVEHFLNGFTLEDLSEHIHIWGHKVKHFNKAWLFEEKPVILKSK